MAFTDHEKVDKRSHNLKLDDKDDHLLSSNPDASESANFPLPSTSLFHISHSASSGQLEKIQYSGLNGKGALPITITSTFDVGVVSTRSPNQLPSTQSMRSLTKEDRASFLIGSSDPESERKRVELWHSMPHSPDSRPGERFSSASNLQESQPERFTPSQRSQSQARYSSNNGINWRAKHALVKRDPNDGGSAIIVVDVIALVILVLAVKLIILRAFLLRRKKSRQLLQSENVEMRRVGGPYDVEAARGAVANEASGEETSTVPNRAETDDDNSSTVLRRHSSASFPAAPPTTPVTIVSRNSPQSRLGPMHYHNKSSVSAALSVPNSPNLTSPRTPFAASDTRSNLSRNTSYTSNKTAKYLSTVSMLRLSNSNMSSGHSFEEAALSDSHSGVLSRNLSKSSSRAGALSRKFSNSSTSSGWTVPWRTQSVPEMPTLPPLAYQPNGGGAMKASVPVEMTMPERLNVIRT